MHDQVVVVPRSMQLPGWEPVLESCELMTAAGIMARQLSPSCQLRTAVLMQGETLPDHQPPHPQPEPFINEAIGCS